MMAAKVGFQPLDDRLYGTWIVFRRLPAPDAKWFRFPDHAAASETMFRERTMLRYLLRAGTHTRIPSRIGRWLRDRRAANASIRNSRASG
jgi:hypothetical protein